MSEHILELQGLTKFYGKQRGIENLSFSMEEGEIFGFIGPNGAGKSTTIRTLLALIFPTAGSAKIFGRDCIRHAPEIAREVGYLPSEVFYYDGMKAIDLLKYAASFYDRDCMPRILALSERMQLDLQRKIEDLSYGNKKKVGIVQGLLHAPRLIILDEPTGGLDPLMQQTFFELLREERERGASILFSSHILSEVQKLCDRVAILKEGRLLRLSRISELQENTYKKFHVEARAPIPEGYFASLGARDLTSLGNQADFLFRGDIAAALSLLQALPLSDLTIEEPTLEEIFLHYYEQEERP